MRLGDGRTLEFCLTGPGDATDLLVFHLGTPGGAVDYPPATEAAARRGIQTVTYSRPGYASSTRRPGWIVADAAGDTAALADHLGASSFLVAGWSGGCAPALACAALLPERVRGCVVVAGFLPMYEIEDAWPDWYPRANRARRERYLTSRIEGLIVEHELRAETMRKTTGSFDGWGFPDVDVDAIHRFPDAAAAVAESIRRSVAPGVLGWIDEYLAWSHPWGLVLDDIRVPVTIRHGTGDEQISVEEGRWLAAHIPGARAQILQGEGHMSVAMPFEPVMEALLDSSP